MGTREERWMSADNRHYSPPAGVFVWTHSAVRVHTQIFRRHTNTYTYIGSGVVYWSNKARTFNQETGVGDPFENKIKINKK